MATTLTFLDTVNRILRIQGFIRGDTDVLTSFSDTTHNATSSLAQIAVQSEISTLMTTAALAYERATGTITCVTNTRAYALQSNFIRFYGDPAFIYDTTQNYQIFEYPGGEDALRNQILTYMTDKGSGNWFYFEQATAKTVAFYPVPDASVNGRILTYQYEKSVTPVIAGDLMPFQNNDEAYAFCECAARRFKYIYEGKNDTPVDRDPVYVAALSKLNALMTGKNPSRSYGRAYV